MANNFSFWFLAFPDIKRPIGGIKQIHRIAESLMSLGFQVHIVQDDPSFQPDWFASDVIAISKTEFFSKTDLSPSNDIIVLPETFYPIFLSVFPEIKKIILNQNGAYSFGVKGNFWRPSDVLSSYGHSSIIQIWCVSQYDLSLIVDCFNVPYNKVFLLINGIETDQVFLPKNAVKQYQIAYMPRKNSRDSQIVSSLLAQQSMLKGWRLQAIENLDHGSVIKVLQESLVFLSFGHPEGFGLPVAEAMACGCSVIGYTGLGGRELFEIGEKYNFAHKVEFGDWTGFLQGILSFKLLLDNSPEVYISAARALSNEIRSIYNPISMSNSIRKAVASISIE